MEMHKRLGLAKPSFNMQNRSISKLINPKTLTLVFCFVVIPLILIRSEERRVGKEC